VFDDHALVAPLQTAFYNKGTAPLPVSNASQRGCPTASQTRKEKAKRRHPPSASPA